MSLRIPVSRDAVRKFPRDVAIFSDNLLFTTLAEKEVHTHSIVPYVHPTTQRPCALLSVDDEMYYQAFANDYGPLNLSFVFDACQRIHSELHANPDIPLCIYTSRNAKAKSNMALMVALYCLVVEQFSPWRAFAPIAEMELRAFRDAGPGRMEFGITVQDCLYGMDKAMMDGLLDLAEFEPTNYRWYEQVYNGDLNILGPFIPFASPIDPLWALAAKVMADPSPANQAALTAARSDPPKFPNHSFQCISQAFEQEEVGLVVRLNDELYDRRYFTEQGIDHVDMYFDDGTNPSDDIVRAFIRLAEEVIEGRKKKVAVHCKAGLGRTGVLIGAYFIYKYGFSAQEVIAFMRIVRPGMVVGPQQQYMVANQMKWVRWAARDSLVQELKLPSSVSTPSRGIPLHTPPLDDEPIYQGFHSATTRTERRTYRTPVEELKASTRHRSHTSIDAKVPAMATIGSDAVGQPRKGRRPVGMEDAIEVEEIDVDQVTVNLGDSASAAVSTTTSVSSVRGVKRGAGRAPLAPSSTIETKRTSTRATLEVPSATLARSSSTSSIQSVVSEIDDRASKRRPPGSPALRGESPLRVSQSPSRPSSPYGSPLRHAGDYRERPALVPSRNMVNVAAKVTSRTVPETSSAKKPSTQQATRNAIDMVRPTQITSPSGIPVPSPRRMLGKSRKSPVGDEPAPVATPERAKTKSSSRQAEIIQAGKQELKEIKEKQKKATGSPRFGSRFFTRLGAGSA